MRITLHAGSKAEWTVEADILHCIGVVLIFLDGPEGLSIPMSARSAKVAPEHHELTIIDNLAD